MVAVRFVPHPSEPLELAAPRKGTDDRAWRKRLTLLKDCLASLLHRDHPDPQKKRTGVMKLDSSRCLAEAEITTP